MALSQYGGILTKKEPIGTLGFTLPYNKYGLLTKHEVTMTGYWPSSFFLRVYGPRQIQDP